VVVVGVVVGVVISAKPNHGFGRSPFDQTAASSKSSTRIVRMMVTEPNSL
jgi:hypothetical protein